MDPAEREALVRRLAGRSGVTIDEHAVEVLVGAAATDEDLVSSAGAAVARARLHDVTLDAAVAKSSLRARRSPTSAPTRVPVRPAAPPEPIGSLLPVLATRHGGSTRLSPTELAALLAPIPVLRPGLTLARGGTESLDAVLGWVAGVHALLGRTVLWHGTWERRFAARRLAGAMIGERGACDVGRPSISGAAAALGVTALFVSDDPATPLVELPTLAARIQPDVIVTSGWPVTCTGIARLVASGLTMLIGVPMSTEVDFGRVQVWDVELSRDGITVRSADGDTVVRSRAQSARDVSGALLGWRLWQVKGTGTDARLVSPVQGVPWPRGVASARCSSCGQPAGAFCSCGLYAFNNVFDALAEWPERRQLVLGEVRGWGHAVLHQRGFRCEHAQILRLVAPDVLPSVKQALAVRYECPVLP